MAPRQALRSLGYSGSPWTDGSDALGQSLKAHRSWETDIQQIKGTPGALDRAPAACTVVVIAGIQMGLSFNIQ